ncbi:hypothetical protein DFR29_101215 [Tahibacter aquaticus]|uniref:Vitamin B12 transport system permease protein n=1 Tax=Tahibacter aquaticus TaxID=520092 RepID=A0A4R6Z9Q3_9GAMM|nr:hypothetical protein [Tahibacter aquaticus]TDR48595.1 hypothetical protein DFR29_101215 [Tahibacter aquaticus]
MTPEPRRPRLNWLGLATALMVALAGGAVWALIALWHESELCFLALPLSAFIGVLLRRPGPGVNAIGGLLALLFSTLACAYALGLIATAQVSLLLGQRLTDTLHRIGTDMALSVAWARLDMFDLACLAAALLLGTACAALPPRRSPPAFPAG